MMVRIDEYFSVDVNIEVELGIRLSDAIVFISDYSKDDFMACFADKCSIKDIQTKVIYPATGLSIKPENEYNLPFDEFYLVYGNSFKHKAVKETVEAVSGTNYNFIVIGSEDNSFIHPNVYSYKSGHLEEDFLSYLYASCKAVVFPSLYEGFGLPVVMSIKNKKHVIVYNNALNDELTEYLSEFKDYIYHFDSFDQIPEVIGSIDFTTGPAGKDYDDTWERVATELESFFDAILSSELDPAKLNDRWCLYKLIEASFINKESRVVNSLKNENVYLREQLGITGFIAVPLVKLKRQIKKRLPGMFSFLKRLTGKT